MSRKPGLWTLKSASDFSYFVHRIIVSRSVIPGIAGCLILGSFPKEFSLHIPELLGNLPVMYQCKIEPIASRKAKRVIAEAYRFIEEWRAEAKGARPYVRVKFLGKGQKVFIDDFHYHIEGKKYRDMVGRLRLLPCVKELLRYSKDKPRRTLDGNIMLEGMTPDGERFRVIIRPEKKGGCLQSFYPT